MNAILNFIEPFHGHVMIGIGIAVGILIAAIKGLQNSHNKGWTLIILSQVISLMSFLLRLLPGSILFVLVPSNIFNPVLTITKLFSGGLLVIGLFVVVNEFISRPPTIPPSHSGQDDFF